MGTAVKAQMKAIQKPSRTDAQIGLLQRKCDKCRKKEKILQRSATGSAPDTVPTIVHEVLRSCGQPLDAATRVFMESRLGHDFSQIPLHSRSQASIQTKLAVNTPGDVFEQEADRVADLVLATPMATVSGTLPGIQRFSGQSDGQAGEAPASVDRALASPGRPLESGPKKNMEQRFGQDFSRVRVHTGAAAEQSARDLNANAYTAGQDIVFGAGRFVPGTQEGQRLIAHELTHVVQQMRAIGPTIQMQPAQTFPSKGIKIIGPDANELIEILSNCVGTQLILDGSNMLKDSGKKLPSTTFSGFAAKQLPNIINDPNGIIIDVDPNVPGTFIGSFRSDQPGFHNINVQHIKVLASASGASGGIEACSAIMHEISEAAKGRELGVQGKTPQADLQPISHEQGIDIENKIRSQFNLPLRNKTGSMMAKLYNVNNSMILTMFSNTFGSGANLRTQLSVIKTPIVLINSKPQAQGNEILASVVVEGKVEFSTTVEGQNILKKYFPNIRSKFNLP